MGRLLTPTQQDRYAQDGFLFPIAVLTADEVRRFRQASDDLEERLGGRPRTVDVRQMHLHFPWAFELASHPRVLDAAEDVLGPDLLVWATELFAKHPEDGVVSIGWHRDEPYMGLEPQYTTTAWISLGESTAANGCMRVVRPAAQVPRSAAGSTSRMSRRDDNGRTAESPSEGDEIIDVVLQAGQMSLHTPRVLHGSGPNGSREKRVGFAVRFVAPRARTVQSRPPAVLVRGRDTFGHFELVDPPVADDAEAAVGGLRESAMRHLDAVLQNLERCRC
ncbi:MAG TPA: phytanoyl-CoA dioxygenase family protein [Planctomycetaceae bacterium]|nr:phytanoyl-CoA dioxygenase family protein [Planctomycetaceae bacterium]